MDIKRYLVNVIEDPCDTEDIQKAFGFSLKFGNEHDVSNIIILVPTLNNLDETSISEFLGEKLTKKLLKERNVALNGFILKLKTLKLFRTANARNSIIIVIYATKKMFEKLNDVRNAEMIIVVPWMMNESDEWNEIWEPKIIE